MAMVVKRCLHFGSHAEKGQWFLQEHFVQCYVNCAKDIFGE